MQRFSIASVAFALLVGTAYAQEKPRPPCENEAKTFCSGIAPGPGGGVLLCLVQHKDELSTACRKALKLDAQ